MGCDIRVLQIDGAKDPDEYIVKYGNARFKNLIDKALSIIEFKVKLLKQNLNLENTNDKIKFLNEIAKLISKIDNNIEREIYIENIAKEYEISKEAIYAEVNKLTYSGNKSEKILDKPKPVITHKRVEVLVPEAIMKRENTVLAILLTGDLGIFQIIKQNIKIDDFKDELNNQIAKKMYEEFEKGNSNINAILDKMNEEEQNHITEILADDYELDDIEKAIDLLGSISNKVQTHISHIDYYVANGIKARICLTQHDYAGAATAAAEALKKPSLKVATIAELGGNNSVKTADVLWGMEIIADQSSGFASFFSHMDADAPGMYASKARQCISTGLYKLISDTDERKTAWFRGAIPSDEEKTASSYTSYCQIKFKMADYTTRTGDYLLMRAEEMILIKAEAECHQKEYGAARTTIKTLGNARDSKFEERLAARTDANTYNSDTNAPLETLMDEILFQRRVELWGEVGRIFDMQRLGLGYNRNYEGSNHTEKVTTKNTNAASPLFFTIIENLTLSFAP